MGVQQLVPKTLGASYASVSFYFGTRLEFMGLMFVAAHLMCSWNTNSSLSFKKNAGDMLWDCSMVQSTVRGDDHLICLKTILIKNANIGAPSESSAMPFYLCCFVI